MSDSFGSFPWDAMTEGSRVTLGSIHSCLEVESGPSSQDNEEFRGQYCLVEPSVEAQESSSPSSRGVFSPLLPPASGVIWSTPLKVLATHSPWFSLLLFFFLSHRVFFLPWTKKIPPKALLNGAKLGTCTPSSCSEREVRELLANATNGNDLQDWGILDCRSEEDRPEATTGDVIFG